MRMSRIQVVVNDDERERFRAQARVEGMSMSEWLREAGRQRLGRATPSTLATPGDLRRFFEAIDRGHDGAGREDDWAVHKARIAAGRTADPA